MSYEPLSAQNALVFELTRQERPVMINGEAYVLVELDGTQRDKYLTDIAARVKTTGRGKKATQSMKNFHMLQAGLVSLTLFKLSEDGKIPVMAATIQEWPARVISDLFDAAKELSGLDDEDEDEGDEDGEEGNDED